MQQTVAAHTPGPWFYDGQNGCGAHVIHVREGEIAEAFGDTWSDDGQQAEANAHLIAAAPELLAALEYVASVLNMTDPEHEDFADSGADTVQALCEGEAQIRAAIAKAKGGAA